ncbi:MAG TPA: glycosyl transferase, partial [Rhizobium sp.]|nr:glycosyl transferase [Rhizobium sp.]
MGSETVRGIRSATAARSREAYVTLVTNADYAMGAVALARSIRLSGSRA